MEDIASNHYRQNGFPYVIHCEGGLILTLFCLLFWDIIYEVYVPGTFISEVQFVPLDLGSKEFYTNRKHFIDIRLSNLEFDWTEEYLEQFFCDMWEKHNHEKSYVQNNLVTDGKDLFLIAMCMGRNKLRKIMERLISNFRDHRAGLPDLFMWNLIENTVSCIFFIFLFSFLR